MKDNINIRIDLEIHLIGRIEGLIVIVVIKKSSKSSSCDDSGECMEQVRDNLITNEKAIKIPAEDDGHIERFGKN